MTRQPPILPRGFCVGAAHRHGWGWAGIVCLGLVAGVAWLSNIHAQPLSLGVASKFSLSEYFPAPHLAQMRWLLSSEQARAQPDASYLVTGLRIELFREDGRRELVVIAPECTYEPTSQLAHSPGPLELQSGDGRFVIQGEGFRWQQDDLTLVISNRVHTIVREAPAPDSQ